MKMALHTALHCELVAGLQHRALSVENVTTVSTRKANPIRDATHDVRI